MGLWFVAHQDDLIANPLSSNASITSCSHWIGAAFVRRFERRLITWWVLLSAASGRILRGREEKKWREEGAIKGMDPSVSITSHQSDESKKPFLSSSRWFFITGGRTSRPTRPPFYRWDVSKVPTENMFDQKLRVWLRCSVLFPREQLYLEHVTIFIKNQLFYNLLIGT